MRRAFQEFTDDYVRGNPTAALLLGDIGAYSFASLLQDFPKRAINVGILEQAMVGFAAGLASRGFHPIIHSIAPFLIERALEQIKVDFGYQALPGTFVSVGASYDYSKLGATHHSPADLAAFSTIPGARVWAPANSNDVKNVLAESFGSSALNYVRLSSVEAHVPGIELGLGYSKIHDGGGPLVVAVGATLKNALTVTKELGLPLGFVNLVSPFPISEVAKAMRGRELIILEPGYSGSILFSEPRLSGLGTVHSLGVPRRFLRDYGTFEEMEDLAEMSERALLSRLNGLIRGDNEA